MDASSGESAVRIGRGLMVSAVGRSGTSVATRLAMDLGLRGPAPDDLMPANSANPTGYWESTSLAVFCDELLAESGATWWTPGPTAPDPARLHGHRLRAEETFVGTFGVDSGWVWKDPRLTQLLPFWTELIGDNPILVPIRNPGHVAASIAKRDRLTLETALVIWERHARSLMRVLVGRRVLVASYEQLLADPMTWQEALHDFCVESGLPVGNLPAARAAGVHPPSAVEPTLTPEQRQLADAWDDLIGVHAEFPDVESGEESESCATLIGGIDVGAVTGRSAPHSPDVREEAAHVHDEAAHRVSVHERFDPATAGPGLMTAEHVVRYEFAASLASGKRVLDIASGSGFGSAMLRDAGAQSVLGVDIEPRAVADATTRFGDDVVSFASGDIMNLSDDIGTFDLIVCLETLEHLPEPPAALAQLERRLAPGGLLVCSTPNSAEEWEDNPHHVYDFDLETFTKMVEHVFANVAVYPQRRAIASIVGDGAFSDPARPLGLEALAGGPPSHFLAVASHGSLAEASTTVRIGTDADLRYWVHRGLEAVAIDTDRRQHLALNTRLNAAISTARAETELARNRAALAAGQLRQAESTIAEHIVELERLERRVARLRVRSKVLEKQIDLLRGSFSWRVTKVLRAMRRAQLRLRRR